MTIFNLLIFKTTQDLYNDTEVEKFVRIAEKLETGSIAVTKAIADITSQLEQYRLTQLDKQGTNPASDSLESFDINQKFMDVFGFFLFNINKDGYPEVFDESFFQKSG